MYMSDKEQVLYLELEQRCLTLSGLEALEVREHRVRVMQNIN